MAYFHDDVIKWKHFPRHCPFVRGIHRSPVNSPHKCQWRGASMLSLIFAWMNGWVNTREAGDSRRHHAYYDVNVLTEEFNLSKTVVEIQWRLKGTGVNFLGKIDQFSLRYKLVHVEPYDYLILGSGHETMVSAVCLSIFLWKCVGDSCKAIDTNLQCILLYRIYYSCLLND